MFQLPHPHVCIVLLVIPQFYWLNHAVISHHMSAWFCLLAADAACEPRLKEAIFSLGEGTHFIKKK